MQRVSSHTDAVGALERYTRAREQGLNPSTSILLSALKACAVLNDVVSGTKIHKHLLHSHTGSLSNIFLANSLIDMYSKCGCLEEAREVFDSMPCRSIVSWNTIIMGYSHAGRADSAFHLFLHMQDQGYVQDARTFVALLKGYSIMAARGEENVKKGCLEKAQDIHRRLSKLRLESNRFVSSSLVDLYVKCGDMGEAWKVFGKMKNIDTVVWNTVILGYAQNGEGGLSLQLFKRMQEDGHRPDERTFVAALNACARLAEGEDGELLLGQLVKVVSLERGMAVHSRLEHSQEHDPFVASALVDMYSKCGSLEDARRVFEDMQTPDVVSWNALLVGYTQSGYPESSLELFCSTQSVPGFEPDMRTYGAAVKACSCLAEGEKPDSELRVKVLSLERGMALHSKLSGKVDIFVGSILLDMYSKCGSMRDAFTVFQRMGNRDVISWNTMLAGYVQSDENDQALEFFARMQEEGVAADVGTYATVVKACGSLAELETGRRVHARISSARLDGEKHVANSLVSMYGRCGAMEEAQQVFDSMEPSTRDLVTWSALVAGYCHQGNVSKVFNLFDGMLRERLQVDGVIFLSVLTLCCHAGLVDKGREYFRIMWCEYGIAPGIEHFTCMVDLLGKANYLDEAVAMVNSMPFEGDVTLWTVLLDACRKWKNVEVGRIAFEAILSLNEKQPGAYVLMADSFK